MPCSYSISSDEILPGNRADGSQVAVVDEVVDDDDVVLVLLGRDVLLRWEEDSLEPLDQDQDHVILVNVFHTAALPVLID